MNPRTSNDHNHDLSPPRPYPAYTNSTSSNDREDGVPKVPTVEAKEEGDASCIILKRTAKSVRFQEVTIREYQITMGDNPSVSKGVPISLCWNYEEHPTLALEEYEAYKLSSRGKEQMRMNDYTRKNLLMYTYGFSSSEIKAVQKQVKRDKTRRNITAYVATNLPGLTQIEDAATSLGRKVKRTGRLVFKGGEGFKPLRLMPRRSRSSDCGSSSTSRRGPGGVLVPEEEDTSESIRSAQTV